MAVDYFEDSGENPVADTGTSSGAGADIARAESRLGRSRTAVIAMADLLAGQAMPSLIACFVITIALGLFHLASAPSAAAMFRACLWMAMVLIPVWLTASRLRRYRSGGQLTGRPLTWRAGHVAGLGVISLALGCGCLMLTQGLAPLGALTTMAMIASLVMIMALSQAAHFRSLLAASLPGLALLLAGLAWLAFSIMDQAAGQPLVIVLTALMLVAVLAAMAAAIMRNHRLAVMLLEQHPRQETLAISARRKKKSRAYNPFKAERKKADPEPRRPWLYKPSEL